MPAPFATALTSLIAMMFMGLAAKLKIDARDQYANIYAVSSAAAGLLMVVGGWLWNFFHTKKLTDENKDLTAKVDRAEAIVPTITTIPPGSAVTGTLAVDKSTDTNPPETIRVNNPKTP